MALPLVVALVLTGCDGDDGALTGPDPTADVIDDPDGDPDGDSGFDTAVPMAAPTFLPSGFQPPSSFGCSEPGTGYSGANFDVTQYGPNEAGSNKVPVEEIEGDVLLNGCTQDDYVDWLDDEKERIATQCTAAGAAVGGAFSLAGGLLGGVPGALFGAGVDGAITTLACGKQKSHLDQRRDQIDALDCGDRGVAVKVRMENIGASGQTLVVDEKGVACQDSTDGPNYGGMPAGLQDIDNDGEYDFPSLSADPGSFDESLYVTDSRTLDVTLNASFADLTDSEAQQLNAKLAIDEVGVTYEDGIAHEFVNVTQSSIDVRIGYDEAYSFEVECPDESFSGSATLKFFMAGSEKASLPVDVSCRVPSLDADPPSEYVSWDGGSVTVDADWGETTGQDGKPANEWTISTNDTIDVDVQSVEIETLVDGESASPFLDAETTTLNVPAEGETTLDMPLSCPTVPNHADLADLGVNSDGAYDGRTDVRVRLLGASDVEYATFDYEIRCHAGVDKVMGGKLHHHNEHTINTQGGCPKDGHNSNWGFEITGPGTIDVTWWQYDRGSGSISFSAEGDGMWVDGYWVQSDNDVNVSTISFDFSDDDESRTYNGGPMPDSYDGAWFDYEGTWSGSESGCFRGSFWTDFVNMGTLVNN